MKSTSVLIDTMSTSHQNGYVYLYATNESGFDVWFDDLFVTHRTGPLLQEAHFYPFGMEITPLSSKAVLKTPNERMLQQNEWDEEFGLDLHDFDARLYDASIGRFWGVDEQAHEFSKLSPYSYSANSPLMYVDPDGRIFFKVIPILAKIAFKAIAKTATKAAIKTAQFAIKSKVSLSAKWASMSTAKKVGFYAGGGINVIKNRNQITSGTVAGGIWRSMFYFGAGAVGSATAMGKGLGAIGIGVLHSGIGTVFTDALGGHIDTSEDIFRSFARGGTSALFGKSLGKTFGKGLYNEAAGEFKFGKFMAKTGASSLEKGVGNVMDKYAEYGSDVASSKGYGGNFYWNAFFFGAAAGALDNVGDEAFGFLAKEFPNSKDLIKLLSVSAMSFSTDLLKNRLMYNNSTKKYRESMNKNKPTKNFWSLVDYGLELVFFSEGFNLRR